MLGVHFAITLEEEAALVAAGRDDDTVDEILEDIEENADATGRLKVDTDKAWDAIHRCLTDGTLGPGAGTYPLNQVILGGRDLREEPYVLLLDAKTVADVAAALPAVEQDWFRDRIATIGEDFDYVWPNFEDVRAFFTSAAARSSAVIFTAT